MALTLVKRFKLPHVCLLGLLFVAACSSSNTSPVESDSPEESVTNDTLVEIANDVANSDPGGATVSEPVELTSTRVRFDITVPPYVSDALQVRLRWGDKDINAIWVADESWTLSEYFPKETQQQLVVTFSDNNGGIVLGSYEREFKTGSSRDELYQIAADEFDTSWDSDGDGVANLEESINGSNPLFDNTIQNDVLRSLLPDHTTLFGQDIAEIPDPDHIAYEELFSWRYEVIGDQLIGNAIDAPLAHRLAWQRYVELTLPEHRKVIDVVKFLYAPNQHEGPFIITINPTTVPGGATVELQFTERFTTQLYNAHQSSRTLIYSQTLALLRSHASVLRSSQLIKYSHEYDVPTYSLAAGGRMLWDSWLRDYYWRFWNGEVYDTWQDLGNSSSNRYVMRDMFPGAFITSYAASSPYADFIETFEYFVKLDEMPAPGDYDGSAKVIWFWNQPEFVNIRSYARAAF